MSDNKTLPAAYTGFVNRFPKLGNAWQQMREAGSEGPLDARAQRLIKLGIAAGAMRQGSVHSNVRKALAEGIEREAIEQVVALAASTLGMSSSVAVWTWLNDVLEEDASGA